MTSYDDARENVLWGAADAFLSNYLGEVLDEMFTKVEEDGDDPSDALDEVITDWLNNSSIYDYVQEFLYEQIDNECMYTNDCMEIITDYGFSDSLAAAVEMGCDLAAADEFAVASAVLTLNMPNDDTMQDEIIRQIQECSSYLERVAEYESENLEAVEREEEDDI